jgi:hypothetical protein
VVTVAVEPANDRTRFVDGVEADGHGLVFELVRDLHGSVPLGREVSVRVGLPGIHDHCGLGLRVHGADRIADPLAESVLLVEGDPEPARQLEEIDGWQYGPLRATELLGEPLLYGTLPT